MTASKMPTRHRVPVDRTTPPRPPRLGKLRLGIQAKTAKGVSYPKAIDYFRCDEDESGITTADVAAAFRNFYGAQPNRLNVMLVYPTIEGCLESAWRLYGQSKVKRICSGETCSERQAGGGWIDKPCVCQGLPETSKDRCGLTHTLWVALPDLQLGLGVFELDTGSEIGERELRDYLLFVEQNRGSLLGHEFQLELRPTKVAPDGKTKTVYTLHPVVGAADSTMREQLEAGHRPAGPAARAELPPAPVIDAERDGLITPTAEAKAAAEAATIGVEERVQDAWDEFPNTDRLELLELLKASGQKVTVNYLISLAAEHGVEATDLHALLTEIRIAHAESAKPVEPAGGGEQQALLGGEDE